MVRRSGPRRSVHRVGSILAISEHDLEDGTHEALRLGPDAVVVTRERGGRRIDKRVALQDLEEVRTRARVGPLELMVALSHLLGAAVFLYLIVVLADRLNSQTVILVLAAVVLFAAGSVFAAWYGQRIVLQFVDRRAGRALEYHLDENELGRLATLNTWTRREGKR